MKIAGASSPIGALGYRQISLKNQKAEEQRTWKFNQTDGR